MTITAQHTTKNNERTHSWCFCVGTNIFTVCCIQFSHNWNQCSTLHVPFWVIETATRNTNPTIMIKSVFQFVKMSEFVPHIKFIGIVLAKNNATTHMASHSMFLFSVCSFWWISVVNDCRHVTINSRTTGHYERAGWLKIKKNELNAKNLHVKIDFECWTVVHELCSAILF